jgi:hypothetical protein
MLVATMYSSKYSSKPFVLYIQKHICKYDPTYSSVIHGVRACFHMRSDVSVSMSYFARYLV